MLSPRDWRAKIALLASIGGAMAMTGFALLTLYGLAYVVFPGADRVKPIAQLGMIALAGAILVLGTLGMAINRRTLKLSKDGLEASGGDDPVPVTVEQPADKPIPVEEAK